MKLVAIILLMLCWICTCPVAVDITDIDDYDPGSCDQSNALQVYSVNDRNDQKKLWICSKENGQYMWKPVDGNAYVGEFLNPGLNCSDILDHENDARDGFYWITLGSAKRKVWCDMTTDGGGYMLVARKHDAMVWDVPSKDKPIGPHSSDKYWTSQLGDAPILDFRVQLSTSDSFDDTKAHWSFRLKNTRKLENLMITDRGCGNLSPGVGDIAYVNDLVAGKIVTTNFRCSVFGPNSAFFIKVGWSMINQCLKKPCGGSGYLHFPGQTPVKFEENGVFSYSVLSTTSGIYNNATAYVGCLHGKCCACYGPAGGTTTNYCDTKCNTINGGNYIDAKKVYTWIWVRSSLPKRIWDRCMEYQSPDKNGKLHWYTLTGDSAFPEKGRCFHGKRLRVNSGVVVVPDNTTAKKVPKVPGLLEYRQDEKELYLRANKTWNLLAKDKEVKGKLMKLEEYMDSKLKELQGKIQATDAELKKKIANITAENTNLQGKIDTKYTELEGKIDAGDAELKKHLNISIPNYYKLLFEVGTKYPGCIKYQWLTDSKRNNNYRNTNYYRTCDNNLSGWYRFGGAAGTRMHTSCQHSYGYCETSYPGYMSGSHPGANDGIVTRTVYFYRSSYGCQYYSRSIQVINCADLYYVYHLSGTPCNARYCSSY